MGIVRGGLDLSLAEQLSNHHQILPLFEGIRSKRVAQIVNANIVEFGAFAEPSTRALHVGQIPLAFSSL